MEDFYNSSLIQSIKDKIKTNNNKGITGNILQEELLKIVSALDLGGMFLGFASKSTNPGNEGKSRANGFYFSTEEGTYTNFIGSNNQPLVIGSDLEIIYREVNNDTLTWNHKSIASQFSVSGEENNFVSFDGNGGLQDSGYNKDSFIQGVKQNNTPLEPDSDGIVNITVTNGENGDSAYQIWLDENNYDEATHPISEFLNSLKASIGAFKFVNYDSNAESDFTTGGIGTTYSGTVDGLTAGTDTSPDVILLMNNTLMVQLAPTKTMMIATQETTTAGVYEFVYVGDLQSAMPNNVVTTDKIDNDFAGGSGKIAGANEVKEINKLVNGVYANGYSELTLSIIAINSGGSEIIATNRATSCYIKAPFSISVNSGFVIRSYFKYVKDIQGNIAPSGTLMQVGRSTFSVETSDEYLYRVIIQKDDDTEDITVNDLPNIIDSFVGNVDTFTTKTESDIEGLTPKELHIQDIEQFKLETGKYIQINDGVITVQDSSGSWETWLIPNNFSHINAILGHNSPVQVNIAFLSSAEIIPNNITQVFTKAGNPATYDIYIPSEVNYIAICNRPASYSTPNIDLSQRPIGRYDIDIVSHEEISHIEDNVDNNTSNINIIIGKDSLSDLTYLSNGYYIESTNGVNNVSRSTGAWESWIADGEKYTHINSVLGASNTASHCVIGFFNSTEISVSTLFSFVKANVNGAGQYDVDVPEGTKTIVISNRVASNSNPSAILTKLPSQKLDKTVFDSKIGEIDEKLSNIHSEIINDYTLSLGSINNDGSEAVSTTRVRTTLLQPPFVLNVGSDYRIRNVFAYEQQDDNIVLLWSRSFSSAVDSNIVKRYATIKGDTNLYKLIISKVDDTAEISDSELNSIIIRSYDGSYSKDGTDVSYSSTMNIENVSGYKPTYNEIIAGYDKLVEAYPSFVTKVELGQTILGTKIYEYTFDSGVYSANGHRGNSVVKYTKPKLCFIFGIHGYEPASTVGGFELFKQMCDGLPSLSKYHNAFVYKVIACANPDGYDAGTRGNGNTPPVDLNRNFDADWELTGEGTTYYGGATPASELETQIIQTWIASNRDAAVIFDCHQSSYNQDMVYIGYSSFYEENNPELIPAIIGRAKHIILSTHEVKGAFLSRRGIREDSNAGFICKTTANGTCSRYIAKSLGLGCTFEAPETIGGNIFSLYSDILGAVIDGLYRQLNICNIFTSTYNLTHITSTSIQTHIARFEQFSTKLIPDEGFNINQNQVTITMGGKDITSDCYTQATQIIAIPNVTGDVVIMATATQNT